jgi:multiple sugar transport system permease protein
MRIAIEKPTAPEKVHRPWYRKFTGGVHRREYMMILIAVVPAIVYYSLMRYLPVLQTLQLSLTDAQLVRPEYRFVGLKNFITIFSDPIFLKAVGNTTYYAFVTTLLGTTLALVLAFILNPIPVGNNFLRMLFFLPQVTSAIAIATIWLWLYQPRFGLFNAVLGNFNLAMVPWLVSPKTALNSLILMALWGGVGYSAIIFIAGIRGIPTEYNEAAVIDGASPFQITWFITMPLLSKVIFFIVVTGVIGSFQVFQQVYLMTNGGPLNATRTISLSIYDTAFNHLKIGVAGAMAIVLFVIVSVLTIVQFRLQKEDFEL